MTVKNKPLDICFWNYDRTRPLAEGTVKIEGAEDARFHTSRIVTEIFERMIRGNEFEVSELGMTYYLRTLELDDPPFIAIPVFPNRCFRHSAIYVNRRAGIQRPEDLTDKTIGELALYGHDSGVMPKGILSDEYGFAPERNRWIVGGIDFPMKAIDFVPRPHPADVDVTWLGEGSDLGRMLDAGEIDALISADVPECVLAKSPNVGRLFEDYETFERAYYQRTGIFPIMHTVVVRRELARTRPELVQAIYRGFCEAKAATQKQYETALTFNTMAWMVPWMGGLLERDRELLGRDWWPYGVADNRKALDAILRYHHEQGLTRRRWQVDELFVPGLLRT